MSAKFKRHYEARLESIADDVKVWFVVYVYGVQSWREVRQCDSKEEAERLAAQRNKRMHAAKTKGLRHTLKPCPFCGNAEIYTATEPNVSFGKLFAIECDKCHASTGYWSSKKLAIAAWNRRAGEERK